MRKIAQGSASAVVTALLVVLLTGFPAPRAVAASAFAPDCQTNQMTGQIDCGGQDIWWDLLGGAVLFVIIAIIAAVVRRR